MSKEGHESTIDVGSILRGGQKTLITVLDLEAPVSRLIKYAEGNELWQMLELLRDTEYLDVFLLAVINLSVESWYKSGESSYEQKLNIHAAFTEFNCSEISTLIRMYQNAGHDSPVMAELNYDAYWTRKVQAEVEDEYFDRAQQVLKWAEAGLPNGRSLRGIPCKISKKCLTKLKKYVERAEKAAQDKVEDKDDND